MAMAMAMLRLMAMGRSAACTHKERSYMTRYTGKQQQTTNNTHALHTMCLLVAQSVAVVVSFVPFPSVRFALSRCCSFY